jgi:hypothetical protein
VLEDLSPLSSSPPRPSVHWVLLTDASGSMAQPSGPLTRWQLATSALLGALRRLPPHDPVSVGSFGPSLQWWSRGLSAQRTAAMELPPPQVGPRGPTNLQPVLRDLAEFGGDALPLNILILTDAEAEIQHADELAAALARRHASLYVLAIGRGAALPELQRIATATGGNVVEQLDADRWIAGAKELLRGAADDALHPEAITVRHIAALADLPSFYVELWNRTWLKERAELAAESVAPTAEQRVPMAAQWPYGAGAVLSAAYAGHRDVVQLLAMRMRRAPRDPRFLIQIDPAPDLTISVDAHDQGRFLNQVPLSVELLPTDGSPVNAPRLPLDQVGPGQYRATLEPPSSPVIAVIRHQDGILARLPVAGRYAPEFAAIGNDYTAMKTLADRSGGAVISPAQAAPLDLPAAVRPVDLTTPFLVAAAALLSLALLRWRLG